ncbi:hypothetical protein PsYK624_124410 [Phanerochaete sordida]|uniref:Uncharacterized protein n=1 Tax=Phanerochaete sordida TaxID=48140 RepID=A0A9P3GIL5_9APHY|nr:hypothetical protein PsYK624_124410 [Phanerochaete sordida]
MFLATVLDHYPNLRHVNCGNVQWEPYDLRSTFIGTPDIAAVFVLRPSGAPSQKGEHPPVAAGGVYARLALRRNDFLSLTELLPGTQLLPTSDVRLVEIHAFFLAAARHDSPGLTWDLEQDFREAVLHVGGTDTFSAAGSFVRAVGTRIEDLTVRPCVPLSLSQKEVDALCQAVHIQSCTSLASFTVCFTLMPGTADAASTQWRLILALLRRVPPQSLRRLRLVVVVEGGGLCLSTRSQLKQMRWRDVGGLLPAFVALKDFDVAVVGEGEEDSEVWQDLEFHLRGLMPEHVRLRQERVCVL